MRCSMTARAIGLSFHRTDRAVASDILSVKGNHVRFSPTPSEEVAPRPACHQTIDHRIAAEGGHRYKCGRGRNQGRVRKTVLDHHRDLFHGILPFRVRQGFLHCRAAAFDCSVDHRRGAAGDSVRPNRDRRRRAARFSRSRIADVGSGVFADRSRARHHTTFGSAGRRRAFSLLAQSALSGKPADGGWNRRPRQPFRIYLSGGGELDFYLSANFSRRRFPVENSGGIYRAYCRAVPRFWPALKPRVPSGNLRPDWAGRSRRELCLVVRSSRVFDRRDPESLDRCRCLFVGFVAHFLITRQIQKQRRA